MKTNKIVPLHTDEVMDSGSKTDITGVEVAEIRVVVSDSAFLSK
ncbi:MAG TPA: hypothetical protein PLM81_08010 [Ginsengibacter sp.]|nr:hypothetical protein [Ginsengibacter sp.]HRP17305.1 hypothetical protein [Ginsengibacter sp.]HRP45662.1 hypothetical protein [Ginsengibacter sp.]